ncbi:MAG: hypothetical protein GY822_20910, partial [Deltaproteobacteria bacterium]|nr:hypothetical protein [Deltaproteobacteria bacterium]
MDTDCIEDDVANCEEDGVCNLLTAVQDQEDAFNAMSSFMRRHRVCSKSFAVGMKFNYWNNGKKRYGKSVVKEHYGSIKEEAVQSGLVSAALFQKEVVEKAARYIDDEKCRGMKSGDRGLAFGVKTGDGVQTKH